MYQLMDVALITFDDELLIFWVDNTPEQTIQRLTALGVQKCIVKLGGSSNGGFLSAYLAGAVLVNFACVSERKGRCGHLPLFVLLRGMLCKAAQVHF